MTGLVSVTAAANELGVIWIVFNDGELAQIAQAQEVPYQRRTCTTIGSLDYEAFAKATGCAYVPVRSNKDIVDGVASALRNAADNKPVIVDVRIDYSKKTYFTRGIMTTNFWRLPWAERLRMAGRAVKRRLGGG